MFTKLNQLRNQKYKAGFSLVEVIIVSALTILIFTALFSGFKISLELIAQSRVKLTAMSLAHDRIEYVRSLPYNSIGTVSGIPLGTIPQNRTVSLNGINFNERILIEYVDDPADGLDTATTSDGNGIPADYKRIKIEYSWIINGETKNIALISNIVPRSIETTAGGGTVRINVLDQNSQFLPGASVRLINSSSSIDVTKISDFTGTALFSGAPAGSGYEVIVTGPVGGVDYSVDQTYMATTSNPIPVSAPFSLLESDVSTLTFKIGPLSDLSINLISDFIDNSVKEDFNDLSGVATSTAVVSDGDNLELIESAGVYETLGEVKLLPVAPTTLHSWAVVQVGAVLPANTEYRIFVYQPTTPYTLVPDSDLPGNSAGFTNRTLDISSLDVSTYPALALGIQLISTDTAVTPSVDSVEVLYREDETPLASEDIILQGAKLIGTDGVNPIYKTTISTTTDSEGRAFLPDLEFDLFNLDTAGTYTLAGACPGYPISHQAGVDGEVELWFVPPVVNSLKVKVVDSAGVVIPATEIALTRPGYGEFRLSNACGSAFFDGISASSNDFVLSAEADGFQPFTQGSIEVTNNSEFVITLLEL